MAKLSLCMIVRDEGELLGRAIRSFEGVADEVVVVDTGSKDDTVAVARDHGARVVHHPWADDFSAARNAGFDACASEWIFALDADEFLLPESRAEVRKRVETGGAQGYTVFRRDVTPGGVSEMRFFRLGRRDSGRRLVGRIHERFEPPWSHVENSEIRIQHEGYVARRNEARLRRNVRLLEMELGDRPGQAYYLADLAHAYWLLGDPRWPDVLGAAVGALDLDAPRAPVSLALALIEIVLSAPEGALPPGIDSARAEALAERWYPRSVPLLAHRARLAFGRGDLAGAVELGERALRLWETAAYDRTISFDPSVVGAEFRLNLGVALANVGRLRESLARFEEAAQDPRFAEVARANAAAIQGMME